MLLFALKHKWLSWKGLGTKIDVGHLRGYPPTASARRLCGLNLGGGKQFVDLHQCSYGGLGTYLRCKVTI
jgi:hypothetical protein